MKPIKIVSPAVCKLATVLNGGAVETTAITLFPFIFSIEDLNNHPYTLQHETIHFVQQAEMLIIFFYIFYLFDFLYLRLFKKESAEDSYYQIRFEEEAYKYMTDLNYLENRKPYAWREFKIK